MRTCHHWTDEERDVVRRDYRQNTESAKEIAARLGVTYYAVKGQVMTLGIHKVTDRKRWSPDEEERLAELIHQFAPQRVAKMMHRSIASVTVRSKRLKISRRIRDGWFTALEVREILGVEHRWVLRHIKRGELRATPHNGTQPQQGGMAMWHITEKDLVRFIRDHASELNGRNVDLPLIVMLLIPTDGDRA